MNRMNSRSLKIRQILPLLMVYGVMAALALVANVINPGFLSQDNMYSILKQVAFLGIACIGQTFVILTGGIDLSLRYMILFRGGDRQWLRRPFPADSGHGHDPGHRDGALRGDPSVLQGGARGTCVRYFKRHCQSEAVRYDERRHDHLDPAGGRDDHTVAQYDVRAVGVRPWDQSGGRALRGHPRAVCHAVRLCDRGGHGGYHRLSVPGVYGIRLSVHGVQL